MNMKTKAISVVILAILMVIGIGGCSKGKEYNPDDYLNSILSGDYGNGRVWDLKVTLNDEPISDYGYIRFDSKNLEVGDFRFVNVIPGVSNKEFKNIPLTATEEGMSFSIEYDKDTTHIVINGVVSFQVMTVNIKM